jgi:myo-inositol 2-dehydrogenase/D-chiro-inositol 1-dehydrogenase
MDLKIGVIGTGGIGEAHVRRISEVVPGALIVAVNDINIDVCKRIAAQYGARFEAEPHALINAPDVDAVIIASWDPTHEEFAVASIKAGKYALCEKPLADSASGCIRIMEAEIAGGKRLLQVGFMRRYDESYRQLKAAIDSGCIGAPLIVHSQHRNKVPAGAKHTTEMTVSGSLVHEFDITRFLLNDEYISAQLVYPRTSRHAHEGLIDPQIVYLETRKGIRIDFEMFMYGQYGYDVQCEVVGEEGTIRLPDPANVIMRQAGAHSYGIFPSWADRFSAAYETELREWVRSIKAGKLTGPNAWDGYVTSAVAEACTKSRIEKTIIPIDLGECPRFYSGNS